MDQVLIVFVKYSNATSYRLARRRQSRHEDMQTERRTEGLRELETTESSPSISIHFRNLSVHDPEIIHEVQQFHSSLAALESVLCSTCLEQFPSINTNVTRLCRCCLLDTDVPKLFSAENNMDPGAVPSEFYVSCIHFIIHKSLMLLRMFMHSLY